MGRRAGGRGGESGDDATGIDTVRVASPPVELELHLLHPLWTGERDTLDALAVALGTALERARLDAEAREQQIRADVVRARAAFLATVTHDLRTPLATIKTATGALLMPDDALTSADRRELAADAHHEVDRLIRLVDKTLELSRIRAGAVVTDTVELAPADLVRLATELSTPSTEYTSSVIPFSTSRISARERPSRSTPFRSALATSAPVT